MRLSYRPLHLLTFTLDLDNITDTRYTINRGYEMPGFTLIGGFKLTF